MKLQDILILYRVSFNPGTFLLPWSCFSFGSTCPLSYYKANTFTSLTIWVWTAWPTYRQNFFTWICGHRTLDSGANSKVIHRLWLYRVEGAPPPRNPRGIQGSPVPSSTWERGRDLTAAPRAHQSPLVEHFGLYFLLFSSLKRFVHNLPKLSHPQWSTEFPLSFGHFGERRADHFLYPGC